MARVVLKNVTRRYGDFKAVDDLSLNIEDKEFIVLVGPSGCGKSTTLRMIAGLETVSAGEIWIGDTLVNDLRPKQRDIAMVFQSYALYPHMNIYDNMSFGLRMTKYDDEGRMRRYSKSEIDDRVRWAADLLGIVDQLEKKPKELSGGQRQRVALGRALVRQPKVFLMDEPLSNLDAKLRAHMRIELRQLHQKLQTTTIYVTHDQMEAMTLADRMAVLNDGILQQFDPSLKAYNHPSNKFVASFIGSPSMNFLKGKLAPRSWGYLFDAGEIRFPLHKRIGKAVYEAKPAAAEVTFGIRPENIAIVDRDDEHAIPVTVYGVELLGNSTIVYVKVGEMQITIQTDTLVDLNAGEEIAIDLTRARAHIFDGKDRAVV